MTPQNSIIRKESGLSIPDQSYKMVSFDNLEILEFKTILGDNPGVSSGAPLALGKLTNKIQYDIDVYEYFNPSAERPHRNNLVLSVSERATILLNAGYNLSQIANATLSVQKVQKERAESFKQAERGGTFGFLFHSGRALGKAVLTNPWAKSA